MDLWNDIESLMKELKQTLSEYKKYNKEYAENEYKYRTALSKRLTQLRAEGQAVTHLADIARGEEEIAQLRYKRDISEGLKKSAEEVINFYKLYARLKEGQLNREWGNTKNE